MKYKIIETNSSGKRFKILVHVFGMWINIEIYAFFTPKMSYLCYDSKYKTEQEAKAALKCFIDDVIRVKSKTRIVESGKIENEAFINKL